MARSADPSTTNNYSSETSGDHADSPVLRWAQVVRGDPDSSAAAAAAATSQSPSSSSSSLSSLAPPASEQPTFSDCSTPKAAPAPAPSSPPPNNSSSGSAPAAAENPNGNSNRGIGFRKKKPAWNKPSNGVVAAAASEGGSSAVMGGPDSWPALSESARASPKPSGSADSSSSSSSSKPLADGSISDSKGPVKINSPRKQASSNNANPNSTQNHPTPVRPRTMRRGVGGPPHAHSNFAQPSPPPPPPPPQTPPMQPPPPPFPVFPVPPANAYIPIIPDYSPRDPSFRRPVTGFVSQPHLVNDPRNSQRRGNFGQHHHGDGAYHNNNYGNRRDQDRSNYGNAMDAHMQPQRGPPPPRGFLRQPPPNASAFIAPVPVRHFHNPMGFPAEFVYLHPYESTIRAASFMPPSPPPIPNSAVDPNLPASIVKQIEFYFSEGNLFKDTYLRKKMDHQGWVPISLILTFPRIKKLTQDGQLILNSLRASSAILEVQGDKIRKWNDWKRWPMTPDQDAPLSGSVSSANSSQNSLASSFQQIALDEASPSQHSITSKAEPVPDDGPENRSTESQLANGQLAHNARSS